ncbi:Ig-like domain-containing protein [Pedosphaera parvula]|uniref:Na-Ca exchanger/integrin-beta4 n=1 Tax=Pedosphaera parvula (strain Ellin514) TaxID=320771 RepID=B9XJ25_PEDPL|nr:Ig-like domain-containing protein [Pedosphaera parvula]EEF60252.1 Na-Ca exchanger/integrin-beta4 [Pedosphaera parvula Ellin514]
MIVTRLSRLVSRCLVLLSFLVIGSGSLAWGQSSSVPFAVSFFYPTNGQTFTAPALIGIHARVTDSNLVTTVQYFSGSTLIKTVTNTSGILLTNSTQANPFEFGWSNVTVGTYTLTAIATDSAGLTATSAPISVTVKSPAPPPPVPFAIRLLYPTNNQTFTAPTNVTLYASVTDSNLVTTVQFFAGTNNLGTVTNTQSAPPTNATSSITFYKIWSNVLAGTYTLTAIATDSTGHTATSAPISIVVKSPAPPPPVPFLVSFFYPTNGQIFTAPANIGVHARVTDSNLVTKVQYFAGSSSIGTVTNNPGVLLTNSTQGNPFELTWSNVLAGTYTLTAIATDSAGLMATSAPISIIVNAPPPPPPAPFIVSILYPTNNQAFTAPTNINIYTRITDSNLVNTVQFFAGTNSLGTVTNLHGLMLTNSTSSSPFYFTWSNVLAGSYTLTAIATDSAGLTATSAPVAIIVKSPPPPPPIPFLVSFWYPTNGQTFTAPATIGIHARVTDSNLVTTVQYFAGSSSLGIITNTPGLLLTNSTESNPFFLSWSNVAAGTYILTAVATDSAGLTATSAPISIIVKSPPPPPVPFTVGFYYPTNGQYFLAPATVGIHARVTDSNLVTTVQYFANNASIGIVTNASGLMLTNTSSIAPFFLAWSNVLAGNYTLTAVATDSAGITATSAPVTIMVVTNLPATVSIYAPDPVAIEGTNAYAGGTNTATFLVRRDGATNVSLTVYYSIGGTATNGVDYVAIPYSVTIPAGQTYTPITIVPLADADSASRPYDTVVLELLALLPPGNLPPSYFVGSPRKAGAIILEETALPIIHPTANALADNSIFVSQPATNGMNFCLQVSTNLVNWLPVCTNTVLKGSAAFVDPNGGTGPSLFYRFVPVDTAARY